MIDALDVFDGTFAANPPTGAAITVTRRSTNILDLRASRDAAGGMVANELHVNVTQAFAGGTSLQISFQTSPDATTWVDLLDSPVYPLANLVLGAPLFKYKMPYDQLMNTNGLPNRYISLLYTVVGTMTAGAVIAYISAGGDRQIFKAYATRYSIDA